MRLGVPCFYGPMNAKFVVREEDIMIGKGFSMDDDVYVPLASKYMRIQVFVYLDLTRDISQCNEVIVFATATIADQDDAAITNQVRVKCILR